MRLSRFGVLGDIHCEDEHLEVALATFDELGLETALSVGDIVDGQGDPNRTIELLRAHEVIAVAGNHDRWLVTDRQLGLPDETKPEDVLDEHRLWLEALPSTRRFETPRGGLLLCHGVGQDDMALLKSHTDELTMRWMEGLKTLQQNTWAQLMVGGHTHERMVRRLEGLTVINAGTLHRDCAPGFIAVDLEAGVVRAFDLDGGAREVDPLELP